ncbi:MAG: 30S ribosomal protein S2 [Candidatus Paceibacterota bacterium]|jgi:small subunit ribosomal protein S2
MQDINEELKKDDQNESAGQTEEVFSSENDEIVLEMAKAGVFYGHKKSRRNPKFEEFIFTSRNGVEIIDLAKTLKATDTVAEFIKKNKDEKKTFMIVGTQPSAKDSVLNLAKSLENSSYVINKWIGGLVTNFSILYKRIEYFKKRKKDLEEGKFEGYTKKERLLIKREVDKMGQSFLGLDNYIKIPDILLVIDSSIKNHITAIKEAKKKKILVVGIIDNDDNPNDFDLFIPANDHSRSSINWVVNRIISKLSNN